MDGLNIDDVRQLLINLKDEKEDLGIEATELDVWLASTKRKNLSGKEWNSRSDMANKKAEVQRKIAAVNKQIRHIEDSLKAAAVVDGDMAHADFRRIGKHDVKVTDHALVRWMQRKHGIDVDEMKRDLYAEVMGGSTVGDYLFEGTGLGFKVESGGIEYVVDKRTGIVVTVLYKTE